MTPSIAVLALSSAAQAHERDPLPATWAERPSTVPRGWSTTTASLERVRAGPGHRSVAALEGRYGVMPRVEVRAVIGLATRAVSGRRGTGLDDPEIGVRWSLLRREPPATSVAVDLGWRAPFGARAGRLPVAAGVGVLRPAVHATRQIGPLRVAGNVGAVIRLAEGQWDPPDAWTAGGSALIQLGPLAPWGSLDAEGAVGGPWIDGLAGIGVQLTRGFGLGLGAGGPVTRPAGGPVQAVEPRGPTTRLAVETSF